MPRLSFFSCFIIALVMSAPASAQVPEFPPADWTYQSNLPSAALGSWVSGAGDVNGDGFDDVIVSATRYDGTNVDEGLVLLFLGGAAGLSSSPAWSVTGTSPNVQLSARESAGDINGDRYDDVLLSDGRLFFGSPTGISSGFQATDVTSFFLALDVDSDGYGDIVRGLELWHGSPSGLSPSGVSFRKSIKGGGGSMLNDLTGDGYVDLVIAVDPSWETLVVDEGAALHMFLGRPNGPSRKEAFASNFTWVGASASMTAAGDVDGDGYNDFLLALRGDPDFTPVPGWFSEVYHFRGSGNGFVDPGSLFSSTGDQALRDMDGAGDVNGDGYDDLLILDESFLWGLRARLYAGGQSGPALLAAQPGLDVGPFSLVSGAGDVNGDGYDDLIVGYPLFSDGEAGEGRVSLILGRPAWLSSTLGTANSIPPE